MADLFPGFETARIAGDGAEIFCRIGGDGPPLLMLHGYPQCHAIWHRVAPALAASHRCVVADLRGYGQSSIPATVTDHASYSKRTMARDFVGVMRALGHERFAVLGHDRGARVAYRMALDHPHVVTKLGIVDIVTTHDMWGSFDADMALKAYHWPMLAQPHPVPETLISADPIWYLGYTLASWTKSKSLDPFDPDALALYRDAYAQPERLHAMCDDYRAGATFDRALDAADREAGHKIAMPMHFLWGAQGFPAQTGDPLGFWRGWADDLTGTELDSGHFGPEENPDAIVAAVAPFFAG
jgi:haloacetate dehalogenase